MFYSLPERSDGEQWGKGPMKTFERKGKIF